MNTKAERLAPLPPTSSRDPLLEGDVLHVESGFDAFELEDANNSGRLFLPALSELPGFSLHVFPPSSPIASIYWEYVSSKKERA